MRFLQRLSTPFLLPLLIAGLLPGGCTQAASSETSALAPPRPGTLPAPQLPAGITAIHSPFGAYLAGNIATYGHDDKDALAYYQAALIEKPDSGTIAARTFVMAVLNGRFDVANPLAHVIVAAAPHEPLANLLLVAQTVRQSPLTAAQVNFALDRTRAMPVDGFYQFARPLAEGWIRAAAWHGSVPADAEKDALTAIASLPKAAGLDAIRELHIALIADLAGDGTTAELHYRASLQAGDNAFRIVQLYGNFLARRDRVAEAAALYRQFSAVADDRYGTVPDKVAANPPPLIRNAADGLAEALFDLGSLVGQANAPDLALLSARLALELRPDLAYAQVMLANTLIVSGRIDEAADVLHQIDPSTRLGRTAQLTTAQLLIAKSRPEQAAVLLKPLLTADPRSVDAKVAYGDALNAEHRYEEASGYYHKALDLLGTDTPPALRGQLLFSLGVSYEQSGHWPEGESALRQAIKLTPNNPALLNYLGYALVIRDERLPEAVKLIQAALQHAPKDGYYTDSLGWAYYHQHLFTKAAETLERAATLRPADPEINDHLGDAYWHAGRHEEARIAWRRALTYKPSDSLSAAITAKLHGQNAAPAHKQHKPKGDAPHP